MNCVCCDKTLRHGDWHLTTDLCDKCYCGGIVWAAKQARRERIEQEAIASYCEAVRPFVELELSVEPKRDGDPAIQVHVDDRFFMGFNGNTNEDEPIAAIVERSGGGYESAISEHTGCKVQGPVVQPNVLGSNVTLGDGAKVIEPEALTANTTTFSNPFFTGNKQQF